LKVKYRAFYHSAPPTEIAALRLARYNVPVSKGKSKFMPINNQSKSVFEITRPEEYRCNVYRYSSSLSKLYVRVFKGMAESPSFYLLFSDVGYFDGPMNWSGVDVQRASAEDCLALMVHVGMVTDFMLDDLDTREALAEAAHLYSVQTHDAGYTVRIIAGEVIMLADVPDNIG
jgi:hypothetical protein